LAASPGSARLSVAALVVSPPLSCAALSGVVFPRPETTSRDVERPTRRFDGVTIWNALVVLLVLAMPLTLLLTLGPETRRQMW
jgi:hypothetical protein